MDEEDIFNFLGPFFLGMFAFLLIMALTGEMKNNLNDNTLNTICQKLNNNNSIDLKGSADRDGKLVCISPSYDNTQNIIFKDNSK